MSFTDSTKAVWIVVALLLPIFTSLVQVESKREREKESLTPKVFHKQPPLGGLVCCFLNFSRCFFVLKQRAIFSSVKLVGWYYYHYLAGSIRNTVQ